MPRPPSPKLALKILAVTSACAIAYLLLARDPNNTLPASRIVDAAQLQAIADAELPSLLFLEARETSPTPSGVKSYEFAVVNTTNHPVVFTGYSPDFFQTIPSRGIVQPLYHCQVMKYAEWVVSGGLWCGHGADDIQVTPGRAARFSVRADRNAQAIKVGLGFRWQSPDGTERIQQIWSNEQNLKPE